VIIKHANSGNIHVNDSVYMLSIYNIYDIVILEPERTAGITLVTKCHNQ